jgi:hypothetical protein
VEAIQRRLAGEQKIRRNIRAEVIWISWDEESYESRVVVKIKDRPTIYFFNSMVSAGRVSFYMDDLLHQKKSCYPD